MLQQVYFRIIIIQIKNNLFNFFTPQFSITCCCQYGEDDTNPDKDIKYKKHYDHSYPFSVIYI